MIDGKNFFDLLLKNDLRIYDTFRKLRLVKEIIIQLVAC